MKVYAAIVHNDDGSAYGLTFPDLPGCFDTAKNGADIPAAATEALDLWFEDQDVIEPSPIEAIRSREDVAAELAAGAVLMPISYPAPNGHQREAE